MVALNSKDDQVRDAPTRTAILHARAPSSCDRPTAGNAVTSEQKLTNIHSWFFPSTLSRNRFTIPNTKITGLGLKFYKIR